MTALEQIFLNVLGRLHICRFKMNSWTWRDESSWETFLNASLEHFFSWRKWTVFSSEWICCCPSYNYSMSRHIWRKRCFLFHSFIAQKWLLQKHVNYSQNYSHKKEEQLDCLLYIIGHFSKFTFFFFFFWGKCLTSLFWNFRALLRM